MLIVALLCGCVQEKGPAPLVPASSRAFRSVARGLGGLRLRGLDTLATLPLPFQARLTGLRTKLRAGLAR
jgi:hypothetical protein